MIKKKYFVVGILIITLALTGVFNSCSTPDYSFKTPVLSEKTDYGHFNAEKRSGLMAGTSSVDITPGPGKALAGYSLLSGEAIGVRHHLFANILLLSPSAGDDLVYIQVDLFSGSLLLHRAIADKIYEDLKIRPANIVITGTHTHSGPGNYLESELYNNMHSSNSGFDSEYFYFLVDKICSAIGEAKTDLSPALVSSGKTDITGYTKNRSLDAYLSNLEISGSGTSPNVFEAVNPEMRMMRVDRIKENGDIVPMAALTHFSVHGTAVPPSNRYYSSDVFSYISRELKWFVENRKNSRFTHLVTSMEHGDVSPAYREGQQGFKEAERLGIAIGKAAIELHSSLEKELSPELTIEIRTLNLNLLDEKNRGESNLAERGYMGYPSTGGAEDGPNKFMKNFSFVHEGNPSKRIAIKGQGHKRTILGRMQGIIFPAEQFPHNLMMQSIVINGRAYIPLPFEVTGIAGKRIGKSISDHYRDSLNSPLSEVTVISCSNGYFGYLTTEEEYSRQHYEGASNLYGPDTLSYLMNNLNKMSSAENSQREADELNISFSPGSELEQPFRARKLSIDEKPLNKVVYKKAEDPKQESYWSFIWTGEDPDILNFSRSIVQVEIQVDELNWQLHYNDYRRVDDLGYDISVELIGQDKTSGRYLYETRWYTDIEENSGNFRFALKDRSANVVKTSEVFSRNSRA